MLQAAWGGYEHLTREAQRTDLEGKTVKVKRLRVRKVSDERPELCCRPVAQELGYGERLDQVFAGTPSLTMVKRLLFVASEHGLTVLLSGLTCAFWYRAMSATSTSLYLGNVSGMGTARPWVCSRTRCTVRHSRRAKKTGRQSEGEDVGVRVPGERVAPVGVLALAAGSYSGSACRRLHVHRVRRRIGLTLRLLEETGRPQAPHVGAGQQEGGEALEQGVAKGG